MKRDKYLHITISAIIIVMISFLLSWVAGLIITLALGLAKEIWDKHRSGYFSHEDLLADMLGMFIGTLIYLLVGRVLLGMA